MITRVLLSLVFAHGPTLVEPYQRTGYLRDPQGDSTGTMQCLPKLLGRQVSREGILPARQRMPSYKPICAYSTTWRIREAVQKSLYTPQTSSQNQLKRLGGADRGAEAWGVSL